MRRAPLTAPLAVPLVAVLVLLPAAPAAPAPAHPLAVSQDLRAGAPATITLFLFPDEGPVTGFDVTLPASFRLIAARGDMHLRDVTTVGQVVRFRTPAGAPALAVPDQSIVTLSGTSPVAGVDLRFVAQRVGQAPFDYGAVPVSAPAAAPSGTAGTVLLTVGLLLAGGLLALVATVVRRRRRHRRRLVA